MNNQQLDSFYMLQAIELAKRGLFTTMPNPRVGCVIVKDNQVIAEGWHVQAGSPHAEISALNQLFNKDVSAQGATVYVSLEPCIHFGRTPPCANSLIAAKVKRVVVATSDPNPLVAGKGLSALQQAGIEVTLGVESIAAEKLNQGFFKRMRCNLPWFRSKIAASLDGKTALANGKSKWITASSARNDGHFFRAQSCAILTGINTILQDNPQLTVRLENSQIVHFQPQRLIIDGQLLLAEYLAKNSPPLNILNLNKNDKPAIVFTYLNENSAQEKYKILQQYNLIIVHIPENENLNSSTNINSTKKIDLFKLAQYLGSCNYNEIHVEAGAKLNGALLEAKLIDELVFYFSPKIIGADGFSMFNNTKLTDLSQAYQLQIEFFNMIGEDLRIISTCKY